MKLQTLKSGNILKYEAVQAGSRGAIRAMFLSDPTPADLSEGKAFIESLLPEGAEATEKIQARATSQQSQALMEQHLGTGSSN